METVTIHITGMACGGCSSAVQQALLALDGVETAAVSHVEGVAEVRFDPARVDADQMAVAIRQAGYTLA